jgi:thermitase
MRRRTTAISLLIAVVLVITAQPASSAGPFEVIVKVDNASLSASAADGTGGQAVSEVAPDTVVLSIPAESERAAVAIAQNRAGVTWAEPNYVYSAAVTPNDPCLSSCSGRTQWGPSKIDAPRAWDATTSSGDYSVAILDSGVDSSHPDLSGRVNQGPNLIDDSGLQDDYGHGTHVAGIAGANTDNNQGVAGMMWNARLSSVKVLDSNGDGTSVSVAAGIRWAVDNGYRVVNLSLGGPNKSNTIADAVRYARSKGALLVAAADNDGSTAPVYPADYEGVISVGASTQSDALAGFSNRGRWVDLLAPGSNIVSTVPGGDYQYLSGTSMSTPYVSATAALLWSQRPYLTAEGVRQRILDTTDEIAGSGTVTLTGRLNAGNALESISDGYRLAASDGGIFSYGARFSGSAGGQNLAQPIVDSMNTAGPGSYWLVASDGGVFSYGDAQFYGSTGGTRLNRPVVGAAAARSGKGYWLVASDGGVFSYGDARFYGSTGGEAINAPIVDIVPTVTGKGYWLVAADGGIFSYGDAQFYGSAGSLSLNEPIVGAERSADGRGYWLVAADGGIFSYGNAKFHGSAGSLDLNQPIVGMAANARGNGYWFVAADGGVFTYGGARFRGSAGSIALNRPIVSMTSNQ